MSIAYAIGRYLTFVQYACPSVRPDLADDADVFVWAKVLRRPIKLALVLPMLSSLATAVIWTGIRSIDRYDGRAKVARYVLAFGSIAAEMAVTLVTARLRSSPKAHVGLHIERYCLLTLIILGEGVIGVAKVLTNTVGALGFKSATLAQAILAIFILATTFHLLFSTFNKTLHMGRFRSTCWSLLHFPLHVCVRRRDARARLTAQILLFLEALAAALLFETLNEAANRVGDRFTTLFNSNSTEWLTSWNGSEQQFSRDLLKLGVSWPDERKKLAPLFGNDTAYTGEGISFFSGVVVNLFQQYGVQGDRETLALAQTLIGSADNATQEGFDELVVRSSLGSRDADCSEWLHRDRPRANPDVPSHCGASDCPA